MAQQPHRRPAIVVTFALLLAACGIDAVGRFSIADAGPTPGDGASDTGSGPSTIPDAAFGGDTSTPFDAGIPNPTCSPTAIDDPLTTAIDPSIWITTSMNNSGHPTPNSGGIELVVPDQSGTLGDLWLKTRVPTVAFDVQFEEYVDCGSYGLFDSSCGDGFTALWLDQSTGASTPAWTAPAATGRTLGIPSGLGGAGIAIDLYSNSETSDPSTPALEILGIDATKAVGSYDWNKKDVSSNALTGTTHVIGLSLRKAALTVTIDGAIAMSAVPVPATMMSDFGFTATSGHQTGLYYVAGFHGRFYACDPTVP